MAGNETLLELLLPNYLLVDRNQRTAINLYLDLLSLQNNAPEYKLYSYYPRTQLLSFHLNYTSYYPSLLSDIFYPLLGLYQYSFFYLIVLYSLKRL
jgi:hypothetical protein